MATYWENSCSFGLRYVSWYKCLIVSLVFSHLGFWSGNLLLIAPFPDLYLLVPSFTSGGQISPQESESTNIGNMSIPFQVIYDGYTQVFYAFNVFQYIALKCVVSLYLTRPFICQLHHVAFDGLKSHSPFS